MTWDAGGTPPGTQTPNRCLKRDGRRGEGQVGHFLSRGDTLLALVLMIGVPGEQRNDTGTRSGLNLLLKPCLTIMPDGRKRNKRVGLLGRLAGGSAWTARSIPVNPLS